MSIRSFLDPEAKTRVTRAIETVEGQTAAEIVVTVRKTSGHYRHGDYLLGVLLAFAALLVFLFHPEPFEEHLFPVAELGLFIAGVALSTSLAPLRRLLVSSSLRDRNAQTCASAAFHDMGIDRTRGRTGILIYVSLFERRAVVVADSGVPADKMGDPWKTAAASLEEAVRQGSVDAFIKNLEALASPLARALPRAADDVNELSDEVR